MNLTREEQKTFPDLWESDMRRMIPDFELLDNDRMNDALDTAKEVHGMQDASDLRIIVRVLRKLEEEEDYGVPGSWWWVAASLHILEDMEPHPWFEATWWLYQSSRGNRVLNTLWGSASSGKTEVFAAIAVTSLVVWHGDAHCYIASPYKNAGADKIWKAIAERRIGVWSEKGMEPPWAQELGLTFTYNKSTHELLVTNLQHQSSTCSFINLESAAQVQGKKRERKKDQPVFNPRRGVTLLIGDELIINPAACMQFLTGEGNYISNNNAMSWVGMNPRPHEVNHANAIEFSAPVERSIETMNEHEDFSWRTARGTLLRFCMENSPNRFRKEPVFDYLINDDQVIAATKRGLINTAAMVAAWGWGSGMGNGGVLPQEAVDSPAHQSAPPAWQSAPSRWIFVDLAFGGSDPAGYCCLESGPALVGGVAVPVISAVEHAKLHVERKWVPTQRDYDDFKVMTTARGGRMPDPQDFEVGRECGPNAYMCLQTLRTAARLGVGTGKVSFDSSLRPDVTNMMIRALGSVPWFYSGTRPLREEQMSWPMWPPQLMPDGKTLVQWSDKHTEPISAAWRFAESVIARGHLYHLRRVSEGTKELLSRMWEHRSGSRTDVQGKKKLARSPMWGETLALGLVFGVRFCGALPQLSNEKAWSDGGGSAFEDHPVFNLKSRRPSSRMWRMTG